MTELSEKMDQLKESYVSSIYKKFKNLNLLESGSFGSQESLNDRQINIQDVESL